MTDDWVELRSDTFTKPSPGMRRAMADAEVGDDVFGEDPTVNALQERVAALFGKEAALFVASGTMGNEVALRSLTEPGDEVVIEEHAHIVLHEVGAPATIAQVMLRPLASTRGVLEPDALAAAIRAPTPLFSHTSLVCVENTHQASGGSVWPLDALRAAAKVAHERDCRVFMDGARIFNAHVASGIPVAEFAAEVDALSFCFSKGLGAPIGSMLVGTQAFIDRARKIRRMLGGAMRQVGILAAAAAYALDHNVAGLADDHARARRLAEGFADAMPGSVDPATVETNIVYVRLTDLDPVDVSGRLWERGVGIYPYGAGVLRAVTHLDVTDAGIDKAIAAFRDTISSA
jgi:threonine aldolase